jgi:hypothetical protein
MYSNREMPLYKKAVVEITVCVHMQHIVDTGRNNNVLKDF